MATDGTLDSPQFETDHTVVHPPSSQSLHRTSRRRSSQS